MRCDAFRRAAEALDVDATMATLSPDVVLRSPVREEPLRGRESVTRLFAILFRAFDDLRFTEAYASDEGGELLHFTWRLGKQEAEGVDMMHFDEAGLIDDYRVMVRPLSAVIALRDAVFSQLSGRRPPPGPPPSHG